MAKVIYAALTSLDGFISDAYGNFDWAEPKEDLHSHINDLEKTIGTVLYGRTTYDIMKIWETLGEEIDAPEYIKEYAAKWKETKKYVYSRTIYSTNTSKTFIRNTLDLEEIKCLISKEPMDIGIGGSQIASQLLKERCIDELQQYVFPIMIGSGKKWIGATEQIKLELLEERNFLNGVVKLRYKVM